MSEPVIASAAAMPRGHASRPSKRSAGTATRLLASVLASLAVAMLVAVAGETLGRQESIEARHLAAPTAGEPDPTWCRLLNGSVYCLGEPN
jgi:hypothetical protein